MVEREREKNKNSFVDMRSLLDSQQRLVAVDRRKWPQAKLLTIRFRPLWESRVLDDGDILDVFDFNLFQS